MNSLRTLLTTLLLATAVGACGSAGPEDGPAPKATATVVIHNHNWSDMTVYATRQGQRFRLGTVASTTSRSFSLPKAALSGSGDLALVADPVGSSKVYRSRGVQIQPGQTIELTLENHLAISTVFVR